MKKKTKVYISGSILANPNNYEEQFKLVEQKLQSLGYGTDNPAIPTAADKDAVKKFGMWSEKSWREFIKSDIDRVAHCNVLCLLQDWKQSNGAIIEVATAIRHKLRIMFETKDHEFTEPAEYSSFEQVFTNKEN